MVGHDPSTLFRMETELLVQSIELNLIVIWSTSLFLVFSRTPSLPPKYVESFYPLSSVQLVTPHISTTQYTS